MQRQLAEAHVKGFRHVDISDPTVLAALLIHVILHLLEVIVRLEVFKHEHVLETDDPAASELILLPPTVPKGVRLLAVCCVDDVRKD